MFRWLVSQFVFWLPRQIKKAMAKFLAYLWWDVFKFRRMVIYQNLCIVFPLKTRLERVAIAKKSLYILAKNILTLLSLPRHNKKFIERNFSLAHLDRLKEQLSHRKGALILSLHIGDGDQAVNSLSELGYSMNLITKKFKSGAMNKLWFSFRSHPNLKFIEAHGSRTSFEILGALKKNQSVCFVIDQQMGPPFGVAVKFFGRTAGTAYGLALFSIKTGIPVLPVFDYYDLEEKFHIEFGSGIDPQLADHLPSREEKIIFLTQKYNDVLEQIVLQHPDQWMWVHRRWKEFW